MNENSRVVPDTETPVNPYSLLEAVNRSSNNANAAWLIFMALMSYLLITVAGVSHKDLLLNSDIALPVLQVKIDLTRFFLFASILLVMTHMGVVGHMVLLARKTLEFSAAARMLEISERRTHPLRLELDNFFFVQAIAGPERSRVIGAFLHGMSWLTLVMMPVLLLLYIQATFLPYHDVTITWVHRSALLADIALLVLIGVFLWRLETSFFQAFWRTGRQHPMGLALTALLLLGAAAISLRVATLPEEALDRAGATPEEPRAEARAVGDVFGKALSQFPGEGIWSALISRNLNVSDMDLAGRAGTGDSSLNLRGRDLRFAKLDRSDLHQADMTGANLDGASLAGADLRGVKVQCSDINALLLTDSRVGARCAHARGANFSKARLAGAKMAGVDLSGAQLDDAQLEGAQLAQALMNGASLAGAQLDGADLSGAALIGANFLLASLNGADLGGAKLAMADFTSASLEGANLAHANLAGAQLKDAGLEGSNLQLAKLESADLTGAQLQGSDLTGARIWRTQPPGSEATLLADIAQITLRPPPAEELSAFRGEVAQLDNPPLMARLADSLSGLSDAAESAAWGSSPDLQLWQGISRNGEAVGDAYKARLGDFLARLMCRARFANGAVATGIARRALAPGFKGDPGVIRERLKSQDCAASATLNPKVLRDLANATDAGKGP
jgi:uncharacterized protein YjbI with pentapeptide repeats